MWCPVLYHGLLITQLVIIRKKKMQKWNLHKGAFQNYYLLKSLIKHFLITERFPWGVAMATQAINIRCKIISTKFNYEVFCSLCEIIYAFLETKIFWPIFLCVFVSVCCKMISLYQLGTSIWTSSTITCRRTHCIHISVTLTNALTYCGRL